MKIYLASSRKNADQVIQIKQKLVMQGHEVDAFCDKSAGRFVFSFDLLPNVEKMTAETVLKEEIVRRAFEEDRKWLDWADVCLLILPAGNSAHLEAGYAKGSGKKLVIFRESFPEGEFDVMYGFADMVTDDLERVIEFLGANAKGIPAREAKQYDEEIQTRWQATFFKIGTGLEEEDFVSPAYDREIVAEKAAEEAEKRGYDGFEIVKAEKTIRRYTIERPDEPKADAAAEAGGRHA